jgi:hypothetical protein
MDVVKKLAPLMVTVATGAASETMGGSIPVICGAGRSGCQNSDVFPVNRRLEWRRGPGSKAQAAIAPEANPCNRQTLAADRSTLNHLR